MFLTPLILVLLPDRSVTTTYFNITLQEFLINYPIQLWKDHGFFTEDYLKIINSHWLQFLPQNKKNHYALAVIYTFVYLLGLFGNGLVIYLFIRFKVLRAPANYLIVNLAVSDLLMMLKIPIFIYNSLFQGPALGETICRIYGFIGGLSGTCSICTLAAISFDRYYVIKYPLNRQFVGLKAKICIAISWLYSLTFSVIPLLDIGYGTYTPEGFLTSCSFDYLTDSPSAKHFIFAFFVAAFVVPCAIIAFSYSNILVIVLNTRQLDRATTTSNVSSSKHLKEGQKLKQEIKVALVIFWVILIWFAAWTPYSIVALLGVFGHKHLISPLSSMIPAVCAKLASCLDPFVYALTHPRYKDKVKTVLCSKFIGNAQSTRVWGTQKTRQSEKKMEDQVSVVEEIVAEVRNDMMQNKFLANFDVEETEMPKAKPYWWYMPNFSNRSSSIRTLARNLSKKCKNNLNLSSLESN